MRTQWNGYKRVVVVGVVMFGLFVFVYINNNNNNNNRISDSQRGCATCWITTYSQTTRVVVYLNTSKFQIKNNEWELAYIFFFIVRFIFSFDNDKSLSHHLKCIPEINEENAQFLRVSCLLHFNLSKRNYTIWMMLLNLI